MENNTNVVVNAEPVSRKSNLAALLWVIFFGAIGAHRFYVGKIWTGILWLLTGGLFGFGALVDFFMIVFARFRDKTGARLKWIRK
ncbi:hypothetical protein JM47_01875 [Ureaplasma diversum]|uniref:TM2 domain-containing protein n=2 Tax=Ureaplasma diversum TaxID=42094 RepID=A0A084F1I8_9BACT|nr:TM2 domain-containing protein [Ureaplasma diversum]AJQ45340.1 hypothetical protein JM47_01875 [Ureaplasma diversum]KEZ24080.1 hypothetical protein UDIV_1010 [Ureaplasma diversum NCTC 246]